MTTTAFTSTGRGAADCGACGFFSLQEIIAREVINKVIITNDLEIIFQIMVIIKQKFAEPAKIGKNEIASYSINRRDIRERAEKTEYY